MSGFTPGVILRNTLSSESSPKATDEFDCSPLKSVECASTSSSCPGSRWKVSASPSGGAAKERSQHAIASRSWTAS